MAERDLKEAPLLEDANKKRGSLVTVVSGAATISLCMFILVVGDFAVFLPWYASWVLSAIFQLGMDRKKPAVRKLYNVIVLQLVLDLWGCLIALPVAILVHVYSFGLSNFQHIKTIELGEVGKFFFESWMLGVPWAPVFFTIAILSIVSRSTADEPRCGNNVLIRLLWDPPLLIAGYICDAFLAPCTGVPFFDDGKEGMITDMTDNFCQGGRPMARHVPELLQHRVHSVINMTSEWTGPLAAYSDAGIVQYRIKLRDTFPASKNQLEEGVAFARQRLAEKGGGRVYIHCKGGRGRATAMMLSCLIAVEDMDRKEAIKMMKEKRPVVEELVATFKGVLQFEKEHLEAKQKA